MKKNVLFLLLLLSSLCVYSEEKWAFSTEFGAFRNAELSYNCYEKDTAAEAVFLYDIGKSNFDFSDSEGMFYVTFSRHLRIKVFKKAGIDCANFEIPYYVSGNNMEEVTLIRGFTYTVENEMVRKTALNMESVYKEDRSAHWKVKKFAMPDVKEGSVIEVEYAIRSPFMFNFQDWTFQKNIPVLYSQYQACMIPFYTYTFLLQGANAFDDMTSFQSLSSRTVAGIPFNDMVYQYVMRDVAAFRNEPFITCREDNLIKLNFQLSESTSPTGTKTSYLSTWPKFCDDLLKNEYFGGVLKKNEKKAAELLLTMDLTAKTPIECARTLYDYVTKSFKWNGNYDKFTTVPVKDLLNSKVGGTADLNLLLIGLLRKAGVPAYPVLISTREHGKVKVDYPFEFFFDYVAVAALIDGSYVMMDATEPYIGFGSIPSRCVNERGFLIKNNKEFQWLGLQRSKSSAVRYVVDLTPNVQTDSLQCAVFLSADGFDAMDYRKAFITERSSFEDQEIPDDIHLTDTIKVKNAETPDRNFELCYKGTMELNKEGKDLTIYPFCGLVSSANPLKNETRTYPIDMIYSKKRNYGVAIHVPEGYSVSSSLTNLKFDNDDFQIEVNSVSLEGNILFIQAGYEFKKSVYESFLYKDLQKYFGLISRAFNASVVLSKN
jgi:hypothetical protein